MDGSQSHHLLSRSAPQYYSIAGSATSVSDARVTLFHRQWKKIVPFLLLCCVLWTMPSSFGQPYGIQSTIHHTSMTSADAQPFVTTTTVRKPIHLRSAAAMATALLATWVQPAMADVPPAQMYDPSMWDFVQQEVSGTVPLAKSQEAPSLTDYAYPEGRQWAYSDLLKAVRAAQIKQVTIQQDINTLLALTKDGQQVQVKFPVDANLGDFLIDNNVEVFVAPFNPQEVSWDIIFLSVAVPIGLVGLLIFFVDKVAEPLADDAADSILDTLQLISSFGPSRKLTGAKARFTEITETGTTFDDVAGAKGPKLELQEIVDFLKNPSKYARLGAKLPKGALLIGPPGTGKTLLAKAVAGEAGVPFFLASASEFVELFVGTGAARVRDLFHKAKEKAPCIIFIDELDAVGRTRGSGMGGNNDEREQTVNQLLTEMDGFEDNSGVIVLAATNRADVLDKALLRPGRFDRHIVVDYPDLEERVAILEVHSKNKPLAPSVDLSLVARRCSGFTGADLSNLLNEAAIIAARRQSAEGITEDDVSRALEQLQIGPEKPGLIISAAKKRLIAYHEAGHALVGSLIPGYDVVNKVSVIPRGGAGGITHFTPDEERLQAGLYTRQYLEDQMAVCLGGRVAEELVFGEEGSTIGAREDFQQVTNIARMMVQQFGFSDAIGQVALLQSSGPAFVGSQLGHSSFMSQETASLVDEEIKQLVQNAYRRCKDLMLTNIKCLHAIADQLLVKEVLGGSQLREIIISSGGEPYTSDDAPHLPLPYQAT